MPAKLICDYDAVLVDVRAGMLYKDIAKKHGISQTTAGRIARDAGIVRKPPAKENEDEVWDNWFWPDWERTTANVLRGLSHGKSTKT